MSTISTGGWFIIIGVTIALLLGMENYAKGHDTSARHNRSQAFHFNYNAQFGVYCGWRHDFEAISCVNVGEILAIGD